jgi:hypothetical protein
VLYSIGNARLTFWTEACVPQQLNPSGLPAVFPELDVDVTKTVVNETNNNAVELERLIGVPSMKSGMVPRFVFLYVNDDFVFKIL